MTIPRLSKSTYLAGLQCPKRLSHRASGLNLVVAAIILWNTVYLGRVVIALREGGRAIDETLLPHVAPMHWNHINLTGDDSWRQNKRVERGGFRPLRPAPRP